MALSDYKLTSFTNPVASLDDKPQMSAADLKAKFDANSEELKTKVNGLIDELTDELVDKVDAVNGKGLSTSDYTTEEKTKLAGVEANANNYAHPVSHSADMIVETDAKRFTSNSEMNTKVDRVTGKGLSTNDYTTEEKTKLAEIDVSKEHTHDNKSILDAIATAPIQTISWGAMDTFYDGAAVVVNEFIPRTVSDEAYYKEWYYLIVRKSDTINRLPSELVAPSLYYQTLFCPNGKIKTRSTSLKGTPWSAWKECGHTITPAIAEETDGSDTTFTFYAGQRYKLERTTTTSKTLNFTTPTDKTVANEIEIYMTVAANESVLWGSDVIFVDSEIPTLTTGKYYRVIAEFDPIADKWCVGVIESGASA